MFFYVQARNRAVELGISKKTQQKIIRSTAIFTVAPAIAIILGMITLSNFLGLPLPWMRLSVLGALTYELPAATTAANAVGTSMTEQVLDPSTYITIAWVMTIGILSGIVIIALFLKRMQKGMLQMRKRDPKWSALFMDSLFIGMICAFTGMIFSNIHLGLKGYIPVFVLFFSAGVMILCGLLVEKKKWEGLRDYALPISMLAGMAFSIPLTFWIGG